MIDTVRCSFYVEHMLSLVSYTQRPTADYPYRYAVMRNHRHTLSRHTPGLNSFVSSNSVDEGACLAKIAWASTFLVNLAIEY